MASFKEIRELLLQFSDENNTINEEELFLLSEGFKSVNRLSMKRFESNQSRVKQYRTGFVAFKCWENCRTYINSLPNSTPAFAHFEPAR